MGLIERDAASNTGKHYHPGGEFGFVLRGSAVVTSEAGTRTLQTGDSFYQPPMEWHIVETGPEGAKTVVFRVVERGQPMVVAVE
jgi:quercetin dioxygenase-like cupin family protein